MELVRMATGELEARLPDNFPFRIASVAGAGRCLLATKEIRPEQLVLADSAILLGQL